jgi:hypothetical protein
MVPRFALIISSKRDRDKPRQGVVANTLDIFRGGSRVLCTLCALSAFGVAVFRLQDRMVLRSVLGGQAETGTK